MIANVSNWGLLCHIPHAGYSPLELIMNPKSGPFDFPFCFDLRPCCFRIACVEYPGAGSLRTSDSWSSPIGTDSAFLQLEYHHPTCDDELSQDSEAILSLLILAKGKMLEIDAFFRRDPLGKIIPCYIKTAEQPPALGRERHIIDHTNFGYQRLVQFLETVASEYKAHAGCWQQVIFMLAQHWQSEKYPAICHMNAKLAVMVVNMYYELISEAAGVGSLSARILSSHQKEKNALALSEKIQAAKASDAEAENFLSSLKECSGDFSFEDKLKAILLYGGASFSLNEDLTVLQELREREQSPSSDKVRKMSQEYMAECDAHATRISLLLILAMLGYGGTFNTHFGSYTVASELKHWERLRLTSVKQMAQNVLGEKG